MRRFGIVTLWFVFGLLLTGVVVRHPAGAVLRQDGTPEAELEATLEVPAEATPEATDDVVTIVAWYTRDAENELLNLQSIELDDEFVAQPTDTGATGEVDFTGADGDLPRITIGESEFEGVLFDGDTEASRRWRWFNDEDGERPATVSVQVVATQGPYEDYVGMATFMSREPDGSGVLVIAVRPADGGGDEEAAAEEEAAEETPEA
jgi:hypothetical protein